MLPSSSYLAQHLARQRLPGGGGGGGGHPYEALLTDKDAYLRYLDEQLDRVTNALELAEGLKERQEAVEAAVAEAQERERARAALASEMEAGWREEARLGEEARKRQEREMALLAERVGSVEGLADR